MGWRPGQLATAEAVGEAIELQPPVRLARALPDQGNGIANEIRVLFGEQLDPITDRRDRPDQMVAQPGSKELEHPQINRLSHRKTPTSRRIEVFQQRRRTIEILRPVGVEERIDSWSEPGYLLRKRYRREVISRSPDIDLAHPLLDQRPPQIVTQPHRP